MELKHMLQVVSYLNTDNISNGRLIDHIIHSYFKQSKWCHPTGIFCPKLQFQLFSLTTLLTIEVSGVTPRLIAMHQICWWSWMMDGNASNLRYKDKAWPQCLCFLHRSSCFSLLNCECCNISSKMLRTNTRKKCISTCCLCDALRYGCCKMQARMIFLFMRLQTGHTKLTGLFIVIHK